MNLVLDIGNTRIKAGIFREGKLLKQNLLKRDNFIPTLKKWHLEFPEISALLVSKVGKMEEGWEKFLQSHFEVLKFSASTPLPFKNRYETPKTLGLDRIALIAAADRFYTGKNMLVIDAGTCITYDFLSKNGDYLGGAISPGLQMRFKSLHTFTENLPLLNATNEEIDFLGKTTFSGIQSGVVFGTSLEIDGFIDHYRKKHEDLTIILTGGDACLLSKTIKNSIFAPSNFLLEGLNAILEFNQSL